MAVAPVELKRGEYLVLEFALPGKPAEPAGVLLVDPAEDRLYCRLRRDWGQIASAEDAEVLAALEDDFAIKVREFGASEFLRRLEDSFSLALRLSGREPVAVADFDARLEGLYRKLVRPTVLQFRTHLPQYSLRAAAGRFGAESEVEPEGWVETPPGVRLAKDMFVAHVTGRSMEPTIPDGSLAVFRWSPAGSRQGRVMLVERLGEGGQLGEVTIKRYRSEKKVTEEGWAHSRILMVPDNPEYETWELAPERIRVLAEWIRNLPPEEI